MLSLGPPLNPSGDEGRSLLRHELLGREYHDQHLWQRFLAWLNRLFSGGVDRASHTSGLTVLAAMLIAALLVVGLVLLVTRLRRERRGSTSAVVVSPDDHVPAAELRRRAEAALADGRYDDALVDGYRAIAVRQIERGRLDDQPGATAHEVAVRLADVFPEQGGPVGRSADLFDATMYGDQPVSPDDARGVLLLDDILAGSR